MEWRQLVAGTVLCHRDHKGRFERSHAKFVRVRHERTSLIGGKQTALQGSCDRHLEANPSTRACMRRYLRTDEMSSVLQKSQRRVNDLFGVPPLGVAGHHWMWAESGHGSTIPE